MVGGMYPLATILFCEFAADTSLTLSTPPLPNRPSTSKTLSLFPGLRTAGMHNTYLYNT